MEGSTALYVAKWFAYITSFDIKVSKCFVFNFPVYIFKT